MQIRDIKYCLPVIKVNKLQVQALLKNTKDYDYFEIWVDYIEDIDIAFISEILYEYRDKILIVCRRQNLETPLMDPQLRLSIISSMEKTDAMLDLDVITQQEELSYIQTNNLKISLITSYHNYQQTPEDNKLLDIINIMKNYDPEIIKVATKCSKPKDAMRLLDLMVNLKNEKKRYIILGMGEYGTITRIFGALWGNEIQFAPERKTDSSAPGQLTKGEMQTVLEILGPKT